MNPALASHRLRGSDWLCLALALALLAVLALTSTWLWRESRRPLLLAPTIGRLSDCLEMEPPRTGALEAACLGEQGSAAARIEAALGQLGQFEAPQRSADGHFELGYTLLVPLLNLFERDASGAWMIDRTATARIARTVQEVQRPMVLYLFSTHFSERAPIEPELAADPANIAHTQHGALPVDRFLGEAMYPWSIARTDNSITQRREQAITSVLEPLCALPGEARARIVGVNLLGEVHHLYPSFETGMGADSAYLISDYSEASVEGFRRWLQQRFGTLATLHAHLGSMPFTSWEAVQPPARNILGEPLEHFWQHLDDAAAGTLAISGWAHDASLPPENFAWVRVYVDGVLHARVRASAGRQDVEQALPEVGSRVGWRYDLPFASLPRGRHRIDVMQEGSGGRLYSMGARFIAVMGQSQDAVSDIPMKGTLPEALPPDAHIRHHWDTPQEGRAVFFNPLAVLWHEWRAQQVIDYLAHFDRLLATSCLADVPRRTQQIFPARRSGWDSSRFASDASLRPFGQVALGINIYGEPSYGAEFFDWLARSSGQQRYSVTEFHPLRAMNTTEMRATLERHRAHGAHTLSFFLDAPSETSGTGAVSSPYVLSNANPKNHSDALFSALRDVLQQQPDTHH